MCYSAPGFIERTLATGRAMSVGLQGVPFGRAFAGSTLPGTQKYAEPWPFRIALEVLGHDVECFRGPGMSPFQKQCQPAQRDEVRARVL